VAKTIRFGDLVRSSGRPETHAVWSGDPKKDRFLQKSIRENRLLTIVQEPTSTRKPSGQIGYHQHEHAMFLVFPRRLPGDVQSRVIGINFDLLDEPVAVRPVSKRKAPPAKTAGPKAALLKAFTVTVLRTTATERKVTVTASNQKTAKREALEKVQAEPLEIDPAAVRNKVLRATRSPS